MPETIHFNLNGNKQTVEVEAGLRLIDLLREQYNLFGTKESCGQGECGACTVLVDNKAVNSCLMLAKQIDGTSIVTIEGLEHEGELDPIQEAFIQCGAIQCGYCTPGMIMSTKGLLLEKKHPNDEEIKDALAGNLCRCTGYKKILEAVKMAAQGVSNLLDVRSIYKPKNLGDALEMLANEECKIILGGTDVIPAIRDGRLKNVNLMDLGALKDELSKIYIDDDFLHIGALSTHSELMHNTAVQNWIPVLADACSLIGSKQIRNRASIGGNIVNASPAADTVPVLVAAGASIVLESLGSKRIINIEHFATGPSTTIINNDELLTEILIPISDSQWEGTYIKVGGRNAVTIAVASVAILKKSVSNKRFIACGSVNPTISRSHAVEEIFNSEDTVDISAIVEAIKMDVHPIDDVRASATYRIEVLANLLYNEYSQRAYEK